MFQMYMTKYSTKKVLCMELIKGKKISEINNDNNYDNKEIAKRGVNLVLKQVFEYGFFHADPHPGNIFILENNVICFIDFGMMGIITHEQKEYFEKFIVAILNKDAKRLTKAIQKLCFNKRFDELARFEYDIALFVDEYIHLSLNQVNIGELLKHLMKIIYEYKLKLLPNIYLLLKALVTIEGVGTALYPELDMVECIKPYAKNIFTNQFDVDELKKALFLSAIDTKSAIKDLPYDIFEIIENLKNGQTKIIFET